MGLFETFPMPIHDVGVVLGPQSNAISSRVKAAVIPWVGMHFFFLVYGHQRAM